METPHLRVDMLRHTNSQKMLRVTMIITFWAALKDLDECKDRVLFHQLVPWKAAMNPSQTIMMNSWELLITSVLHKKNASLASSNCPGQLRWNSPVGANHHERWTLPSARIALLCKRSYMRVDVETCLRGTRTKSSAPSIDKQRILFRSS